MRATRSLLVGPGGRTVAGLGRAVPMADQRGTIDVRPRSIVRHARDVFPRPPAEAGADDDRLTAHGRPSGTAGMG